MLDLLRTRLGQGIRTIRFPPSEPGLPPRFRGRPRVEGAALGHAELPVFDLGKCLFSPDEAGDQPAGQVSFTQDYRMASRTREGLVTATGELERVAALDSSMRKLLGRSLRLRSVSAGSCNGCEAELVALGNVVFDLARFGVQFVASPRHADGIVITGAISRNMEEALVRTYEAVPDPRLVIAVGACACSGGPFQDGNEVLNGVPESIPVDLWIPGCPPHPLTILDGLLALLGQDRPLTEGNSPVGPSANSASSKDSSSSPGEKVSPNGDAAIR